LKELIFSEPIVDAVARIKIILEDEGLIKTAAVRRPQLGVGEAEKKRLLDSYRALKEQDYRSVNKFSEARRRRLAKAFPSPLPSPKGRGLLTTPSVS
jgi:hypothetical protein